MNSKSILGIAAFMAFTAVILGALGAHALKDSLSADALDSFKTGVRYQAWHALALLFLGLLAHLKLVKGASAVAWLFTLGVVLFSLSIYGLSTQSLTHLSLGWLGPVTPLGGLFLIAGWALLFIKILRSNRL